jgi:hypothetical protein
MGKTQVNDDLQAETEAMFNHVVIAACRLARVIGYHEDKHDCYITVQYMADVYGEPGRIVHMSWVGGVTSLWRLKGQHYVLAHNGEEWDDYTRLDNYLTLNGAPKHNKFRLDIDHENVSAYGGYHTPEEALE